MLNHERDSTAAHLLRCAKQLGVDFVFTNLGSDHPAFIQAFSQWDEQQAIPEIVVCPHEMTALSAAHGYAMITRRPQLVLVHVDVGTQNLGCSIHNAARGRIPAIVVAGLSPVSIKGDRLGNRTEFIHYTQDVPSQTEIVRQYMKWAYELRAPETVQHVLVRGQQMACADPQGPVYITGAREFWEESTEPIPHAAMPPARTAGLTQEEIAKLRGLLAKAERPMLITSYLGRNPAAVARLVALSEEFGIAVQEVSPQYMNFPNTHPHHIGHQRDRFVDEADLLLLVDTDVPWLPQVVEPRAGVPVISIDCDPQKDGIGLWCYPLTESYRADSNEVLAQLLAAGREAEATDAALLERRRHWIAQAKKAADSYAQDRLAEEGMTPAFLTQTVKELVDDDTLVLVESPSATVLAPSVLKMEKPGSYFASGGSGLGWAINATIGAKLASPEKTVIALVGDGCYLFGVPSSAYWVAGQYQTPALTIIYNNGGWHSPKVSNDLVHAQGGLAGKQDAYWITIGQGAKLAQLAEMAGGAAAFDVEEPAELKRILTEALAIVRAGRSAVVNVRLQPISSQVLQRRGAVSPA